ncbi:MAG: DUF559 domain-containing protein [Chloroflexi bacterium]|nr:DUF559 domain-containing protein [Chloroflexota bacterium]
MPIRKIVIGQRIDQEKVKQSKQLRRRMTREEATLWESLRKNQLNGLHFRRQQVIHGFIVDFYCHSAQLIVEVDGDIHEQQRDYDAERDAVLTAHGFTVLRIRNEKVKEDLPGVLSRILEFACAT